MIRLINIIESIAVGMFAFLLLGCEREKNYVEIKSYNDTTIIAEEDLFEPNYARELEEAIEVIGNEGEPPYTSTEAKEIYSYYYEEIEGDTSSKDKETTAKDKNQNMFIINN